MHDGTQRGYDRKEGLGDRVPKAEKQKYSYDPGEHIQYRRSNAGVVVAAALART